MAGKTSRRPRSAPVSGPTDEELATTLGKAAGLWTALRDGVVERFGPVTRQWSQSARTGRWTLRLQQVRGRRTIVYLGVAPGFVLASFALGERACRAARVSELPAGVLEAIEAAPRYPEGRGVRLEVRTRRAVGEVLTLAAIKMAN